MLVIRLARQGRNKYPVYRIVAAESARAATSKFVAILGHYNPHTKELTIQKEEVVKYLGNGAQPSNSVIKLLQREKVELPQWVELKSRNRAPKKEPVVKEATPVAEENAEAVEAKVTESAPEDTAVGEEAQVEAAESAEDGAAEAVTKPAE